MEYPVLYQSKESGNRMTWSITVTDNIITRVYGMEHGKQQTTITHCHAKNIGKKNQTTANEQAHKEALQLWKRQIDKGYKPNNDKNKLYQEIILQKKENGGSNFTTQSKKKHVYTEQLKSFYPMLANKWNGTTLFKHTYIQPKLDGVRCIAYKDDNNNIVLLSRNNKQFPFFKDIKKELNNILDKYTILDGELYVHSINGTDHQDLFNIITSACNVRRIEPHENESLFKYNIFDVYYEQETHLSFKTRWHQLSKHNTQLITYVDTQPVYSIQDIMTCYHNFMSQGYEGIMIRDGDGLYQTKKRSKHLLKYKEFKDDEFEIIGAKQGSGNEEGCVVWKCINKHGKEFDVRPNGSFEDRKRMYVQRKNIIGKLLTVKYQNLTIDGIPRFPVGLSIRDYE